VHELVHRHAPRLVAALGDAAPQRLVQHQRQVHDQVLDLASGEPLGERCEHRVHGAHGGVAVEPRALLHPREEGLPGHDLDLWADRQQRGVVARQLRGHVGQLARARRSPQRQEDGSHVPLRGRGVDPHALRDAADEFVDVESLRVGVGVHPPAQLHREPVGQIARLAGRDALAERLERRPRHGLGLVPAEVRRGLHGPDELLVVHEGAGAGRGPCTGRRGRGGHEEAGMLILAVVGRETAPSRGGRAWRVDLLQPV
jgi:hypothetical protein